MSKVCNNSKCKYTNSDASHYCVMCGEPLEKTSVFSTKPDKEYVVIAESQLSSLESQLSSLKSSVTSLRRERNALQQRIDKLWGVRLKKWCEKNEDWVDSLISVIGAFVLVGLSLLLSMIFY